jgi:hypothetical protein
VSHVPPDLDRLLWVAQTLVTRGAVADSSLILHHKHKIHLGPHFTSLCDLATSMCFVGSIPGFLKSYDAG